MVRLKSVILQQFLIITFTLFFLFTGPIILTSFIPIYIFRFIVSLIGPIINRDLHHLIHSRSSVLAQENPYKSSKLNLCVWLVLEGNLNFENFRSSFLTNQVYAKKDNGVLKEPEYQQYYSSWCGFLFWKWDRLFNINNHMRYYFQNETNFKEKQTTEEELRQILKKLAWENFPPKRSPWEFLYIPNYISSSDESQVSPKSVLIFRLHHGFCDGFKILHLLMKEVNGISMNYVQQPKFVERNTFKKFLLSVFFFIQAPYQFFTMLVQSKDMHDWRKLGDDKLATPFNAAFTKRIPLSQIKEISKGHGVSFTAVLLSGITTGVREMMIDSGIKVPRNIATLVAVPIPGHPTLLRNHFIFSFIRLPVGIEDSEKRLKKAEENYQKLKNSASTPLIFGFIPAIGSLFHWMMGCFVTNTYTTALLSNFPGPPASTYFIADGGSTRVTDMNFIAGCGKGGVGMGFLMMSYAEGIRIISQADRSILPNDARVEEMNRRIVQEMDHLKSIIAV